MADTRIFKVTERGYREDKVRYVNRRSLGGICADVYGSSRNLVRKIEAVNADATEGWTDVTKEFLPDRNET